ncbi:oligosaccharide flippase family protein [Salinisphaera sp. T31B1]|uniref:oligosaccharide flippase family protein n=1 Tax=Salinisphaera sp. T31B1 TaxID=727963 RepID=UPI003340EC56
MGTRVDPMLGWISLSSLDAVGRIGLKVLATVLFARWLTPDIFGQSSLTIVLVALLAIIVTAPFEEALTQRKVVDSRHFRTALTVVTALSVVICGVVFTVGLIVDHVAGEQYPVAATVAWFSVILFAQGPISIYTALARRQRAFKRIAMSNLSGDTIGTAVGLALAWSGVGVWSLLAVRFVSAFVVLSALMAGSPVRFGFGLSRDRLRDLSSFAGWLFAVRCTDRISDALFQGLVASFFGLNGAGYLNMALRIIEPMRGVTGSMGHNIAMSFYVRAQDDPARLRASVEQTLSSTSLLLLPLFIGLAASGPTIITLLAGAAWAPSGPLVSCLSLAAALTACTNFLQSAIAARGRVDLTFAATALELGLMVIALWGLTHWGLLAVGAARLVSNAGEAIFNVAAAGRVFDLRARRILRLIGPVALSAAAMGCVVAAVGSRLAGAFSPGMTLVAQILLGVAMYTVLALLFHRVALRSVHARLFNRRAA